MHAGTTRRVLLACGALLLATLTPLTSAHATTTAIDPADIQAFPLYYEQAPYANLLSGATPEYVMHTVHTLPVGTGGYIIVRTSDGSVAWNGVVPSSDAKKEYLRGHDYVEQSGDATFWPTGLRFFDVATHSQVGQIDFPSDETLAGVGDGWVVGTKESSNTATVTPYYLVLHRMDGTTVEFPTSHVEYDPIYDGSYGNLAWFTSQYDGSIVYQIDTAAGTLTEVPLPGGSLGGTVVPGPTTLFDLHNNHDGTYTLIQVDRATGAATTSTLTAPTQVASDRFVALGDGLGFYEGGASVTNSLWTVDVAAGTLGTAVATNLSDAWSMGDGRVALVVEAAAPGTIAIADGSTVTPLITLPPRAQLATRISYDGTVTVRWPDDTRWTIDPAAATPTWAETPWTAHQAVSTSGGVTLIDDLNANYLGTTSWHLSWSGGSRDLTGQRVHLGHGGEYVVVEATDGSGTYQVQRVTTGEVVATSSTPFAVDGSWAWTSDNGTLTGHDLDNPSTPAMSVPTTSTTASVIDVRGRWVLAAVSGSTVVYDVKDVVDPWTLTSAVGVPTSSNPQLGNGFVVYTSVSYDSLRNAHYLTAVYDLTPYHNSEPLIDPAYGTMATRYSVDEAGSRTLAFIGDGSQPKVLALPWVKDAPLIRSDITAPVLDTVTAPGSYIAATTAQDLTFGWTYTDPTPNADPVTGVASYAVRYRIRTVPTDFGAWTTPTTSTTGATLTVTVQPGQQVCAESDATDGAGNTSAWSAEKCSQVDGTPPALDPATGMPRFTAPDSDGGVHYAYGATDDSGVASYDVQVRSAAQGKPLSGWGDLLSGTTSTTVQHAAGPGSEWCFRYRATDLAGNTSAWSPPHCSSVAIEDVLFATSFYTRRVQWAPALDHWYLKLHHRGARMATTKSQTGRVLALWVVAGPHQGKAAVFIGHTRIKVIHLAAATMHRRRLLIRVPHSGRIRVIQRGGSPVGIDALTLAR